VSTDERAPDVLQELYSTGLMVGLLVDIELERAGVPTQLFSFLGWVSILQPVTPGRLGLETGLPATTIRDHVRRLDGRSYHLVLTRKGTRLARRGWPAVVAAHERVAAHLERPIAEHIATARELRRAVRLAVEEARLESVRR
jgi:hypothetical protein